MSKNVNSPSPTKREYHAPKRAHQAATTKHAILGAARELFITQGYATTTVAQIAASAGVAVDTVYATVGRKPLLLRELVETSISGTDDAIPAEERDYVRRVREASGALEKITIYARAIGVIQTRLVPVFIALREAAVTDAECAQLWQGIAQRRSQNMRLFASDLLATGEVRQDLSLEDMADIIWSMNSSEYWVLLVRERGWTTERFTNWLVDAWSRLLLA